jgi:predicted esterase
MKEFDFTFMSVNSISYAKRITVYVVEPDTIRPDTGLLHCCHGWGGNRFQHKALMQEFCNQYNLLCIGTEFRQSGYDFDPVTGLGSDRPYDGSHYQVIDCLNAVRETLHLYPLLNRNRLLLYGGSQGGHISILMTIFAPDTFACAISSSGAALFEQKQIQEAGRSFSQDELDIRDTIRMASLIRCPVALIHGTADRTVPVEHSKKLEAALRTHSSYEVRATYYEGADHGLVPVIEKKSAIMAIADDLLRTATHEGSDDFAERRKISISCETKNLLIDWSKGSSDTSLLLWEEKK